MVSLIGNNEEVQASCEIADNLLLNLSLPLHLVELAKDSSNRIIILSSSGLSGFDSKNKRQVDVPSASS